MTQEYLLFVEREEVEKGREIRYQNDARRLIFACSRERDSRERERGR